MKCEFFFHSRINDIHVYILKMYGNESVVPMNNHIPLIFNLGG